MCLTYFHFQVTSEKVVLAFIERAKQVNHIINAIIDDRFEKAVEDAKAVDKLIQSGSIPLSELKKKKPLLGIPYTSKESTACQGIKKIHSLVPFMSGCNRVLYYRNELDLWHGVPQRNNCNCRCRNYQKFTRRGSHINRCYKRT